MVVTCLLHTWPRSMWTAASYCSNMHCMSASFTEAIIGRC